MLPNASPAGVHPDARPSQTAPGQQPAGVKSNPLIVVLAILGMFAGIYIGHSMNAGRWSEMEWVGGAIGTVLGIALGKVISSNQNAA